MDYRTGREGTTGEEGTAPTFNTLIWVPGAVKAHIPGQKTKAQIGAATSRSTSEDWQRFRAGKPVQVPKAGPPGGLGPKARSNELTMAGGAVPSRQRVVPLQPDPGWAITWGRGEGTQAAAAAELAPRSLSPAPPRACYINRRGTMSLNFVVGI